MEYLTNAARMLLALIADTCSHECVSSDPAVVELVDAGLAVVTTNHHYDGVRRGCVTESLRLVRDASALELANLQRFGHALPSWVRAPI